MPGTVMVLGGVGGDWQVPVCFPASTGSSVRALSWSVALSLSEGCPCHVACLRVRSLRCAPLAACGRVLRRHPTPPGGQGRLSTQDLLGFELKVSTF